MFTVSRWYAPGEVNETGRMVSLPVATLLDLGVTEPQRHLFLASTDNIATLIVSRSPLSHDTLDALHGSATQHGFSVRIHPYHRPSSPVLQEIVAVADRVGLNVATQDYYLDLTPPTDARPFFFNQLRFDRLFDEVTRRHSRRPGVMGGNLAATMTLAMLVMVSMGLVLATIVVPQLSNVRHVAYQLAIGGTAYFLLIGAGFMITEIALLQRMSVFLRPSRLRAQHRSIQPHPGDWDRQLRLQTPAARHRPQAYRLVDVDLRLSRGVAGLDTAGAT